MQFMSVLPLHQGVVKISWVIYFLRCYSATTTSLPTTLPATSLVPTTEVTTAAIVTSAAGSSRCISLGFVLAEPILWSEVRVKLTSLQV